MPIRFRCAYCNQMMGIATRKAGTVVRCPKCAGQVVVPHLDPQTEDAAPSVRPRPGDSSQFDAVPIPEVSGIHLTRGMLILFLAFTSVLIGVAFFFGYLAGKG